MPVGALMGVQILNLETLSFTGTFRADKSGYWIVTQKGETIFYVAKDQENWSTDMDVYDGVRVQLLQFPRGQIIVTPELMRNG